MRRAAIALMTFTVFASASPSAAALSKEGARTADLLKQLVRIDTSNPGGDTRPVAALLTRLFDRHGIANETILAPNGKAAHFIARLKGDGTLPPVLIAAHADVVPAERGRWSVDPFGAVEKDGAIWGRGTMDNKGAVAAFARAVLRVHASGAKLKRDVIFLVEADEEQGEYNTNWLADHHWDKIDCAFVLDEGPWPVRDQKGRIREVEVSLADKQTLTVRLSTTGPSGHSARPFPITRAANGKLIAALARIDNYRAPVALSPLTRRYLERLASVREGADRSAVEALLNASDATARSIAAGTLIDRDRSAWGIEGKLRDTIVVTMIESGIKPNVIPGTAEAVLNARLMPGERAEDFLASLREVIDDPGVGLEIVSKLPPADLARFLAQRSSIAPSPVDTALYRAIEAGARRTWPDATLIPTLFSASTDATPWRQRGVPVYGIAPFPGDPLPQSGVHGDDEHVSLSGLSDGSDYIFRILANVATH